MFTTFVLALNFISLAGIVIGLVLQSPAVRTLLERTYVRADDMARGTAQGQFANEMTLAVTAVALLGAKGTLSPRKIAVLSIISGALFIASFAGDLPDFVSSDSPAARALGGGMTGSALASLILYVSVWPGHFVYDWACSALMLQISKRAKHWRAWSKAALVTVGILALSSLPLVMAFGVTSVGTSAGLMQPGIDRIADLLLLAPFIFNGPVILRALVLMARLSSGGSLDMISPGQWLLLMASCATSVAVLSIGVAVHLAARSRRLMVLAADLALRIDATDAKRLFNYSLTAFAIGNGLCQVFGISISLQAVPIQAPK